MKPLLFKKPKKWTKSNLFKTLNRLEDETNRAVWFDRQGSKILVWVRQTSINYNDGLLFEQGHMLGDLFSSMIFTSPRFDNQSAQYLLILEPRFLRNK